MNIDLSNKHAVVCGSTQGIGRATAIELAALGATVTLLARNRERLESVRAELPRPRGQQHALAVADFSQPDAVCDAADSIVNERDVHILVNNTGGPPAGAIVDAEPQAFVAAYTQHLVANHLLMQAFVASMKAAGYGRIINIISTSVKQPLPNLGVSNTTRGAVANWAKTLAGELGPFGITVNNVLPGATDTGRLSGLIKRKAAKSGRSVADVTASMHQMIPARRFARPEETAAAVAFLASPAAAYINGINLPIDGGRTLSL